jgi:hypothetical protein
MSVPSTRELREVPVSQIARGLNAVCFSCSCKAIDLQAEY